MIGWEALILASVCFAAGWLLGRRRGRSQGVRQATDATRRAYYDQQRFREPH